MLNMANGVLLIVDAFEGPMPQTRFVLQKAIELGLKPMVVVNKVDKENCTPEIAQEKVFDLMFSLDATEEQLDFQRFTDRQKLAGWDPIGKRQLKMWFICSIRFWSISCLNTQGRNLANAHYFARLFVVYRPNSSGKSNSRRIGSGIACIVGKTRWKCC